MYSKRYAGVGLFSISSCGMEDGKQSEENTRHLHTQLFLHVKHSFHTLLRRRTEGKDENVRLKNDEAEGEGMVQSRSPSRKSIIPREHGGNLL